MYRKMYLYRVHYQGGISLDYKAYSEYNAVQQFTALCISLNWGLVHIDDVTLVTDLCYELETP